MHILKFLIQTQKNPPNLSPLYIDRINADDDIDQIDEDTASPLDEDLTKLNKHIRRSSRYPVNCKLFSKKKMKNAF